MATIKFKRGTQSKVDAYTDGEIGEPILDTENNKLNIGQGTGSLSTPLNPEIVNDPSPQLGNDLDTNEYLVKNGIILNKNMINTSYTIPTGYNAMSVGPLDINTTIIINENSTWEIL